MVKNLSVKEILQNTSFGQPVAEEEMQQLQNYFVETNQWLPVYNGEVDIIYGAKGSGKSAIYAFLLKHEQKLAKDGTIVISGENTRGTPVFNDLVSNPPASETEFVRLWKTYFLTLIAHKYVILIFPMTNQRK